MIYVLNLDAAWYLTAVVERTLSDIVMAVVERTLSDIVKPPMRVLVSVYLRTQVNRHCLYCSRRDVPRFPMRNYVLEG